MSRVEETLMRTVVVRSARRCGIIIGRTILFFFFRVTRHDRGIRWWHVKQTIEQVAIDVAARCRSITGEIKHSTQATIPLSIRVHIFTGCTSWCRSCDDFRSHPCPNFVSGTRRLHSTSPPHRSPPRRRRRSILIPHPISLPLVTPCYTSLHNPERDSPINPFLIFPSLSLYIYT